MEWEGYFRFAIALVFVLGLIGLLAAFARRLGMSPRVSAKNENGKRLGIVEVANVDGKRRLVLVRRDGVEHLLLLGVNSETVVERGVAPLSAKIPPITETRP